MGLASGAVHARLFSVSGAAPTLEHLRGCLNGNRFMPLDGSTDMISVGWTPITQPTAPSFDQAMLLDTAEYYMFSMRVDERRIPGQVFRTEVARVMTETCQAEGVSRLPKARREQIRESVRLELALRAFPMPTVVDVVWDTKRHVVYFLHASARLIDIFRDLFKRTFATNALVDRPVFQTVDEPVQYEDPAFLPATFLQWLLNRTTESDAVTAIQTPGPSEIGTAFVAFLADRVVLEALHVDGQQRLTLTGPQKDFKEVYLALEDGKVLTSATVMLVKDDLNWTLSLSTGQYAVQSLRLPSVMIQVDGDLDDESVELEARLLDRLGLIQSAIQMVASLYAEFVSTKTSD